MSSHLREEDDFLTKVDYIPLLNLIVKQLQQSNPFTFSDDSNRLRIDVDSIAYNIAISDEISLPASLQKVDQTVSINFSEECEQKFPDKIRQIRDKLNKLLIINSPQNTELIEVFKTFLTPLNNWKKLEKKALIILLKTLQALINIDLLLKIKIKNLLVNQN